MLNMIIIMFFDLKRLAISIAFSYKSTLSDLMQFGLNGCRVILAGAFLHEQQILLSWPSISWCVLADNNYRILWFRPV